MRKNVPGDGDVLFLYLKKYYFCNKPLSFCKKDIDTFIYVLIISDLYY